MRDKLAEEWRFLIDLPKKLTTPVSESLKRAWKTTQKRSQPTEENKENPKKTGT